jgi:hypothetical protein
LYCTAEDVNSNLDICTEVAWLGSVLEARDFPPERFARGLDLAAEVVAERVDGTFGGQLADTLNGAAASVHSRATFL